MSDSRSVMLALEFHKQANDERISHCLKFMTLEPASRRGIGLSSDRLDDGVTIRNYSIDRLGRIDITGTGAEFEVLDAVENGQPLIIAFTASQGDRRLDRIALDGFLEAIEHITPIHTCRVDDTR